VKLDVVLAGVGGQGVLLLGRVLGDCALARGWNFRQSEVHGMAQRGGAVSSHVRIGDGPVHSVLIPRGTADLLLAVEPMEALRAIGSLGDHGALVTGVAPVANVPDYPDPAALRAALHAHPRALLVPADRIARHAGSPRAANLVVLGAALPWLPFSRDELAEAIARLFAAKKDGVARANVAALDLGIAAGAWTARRVGSGADRAAVADLLDPADLAP
jgi:indolepyruvate ferredoxin oxidoreductase beta subunit